jgi:EpsI family protein
MTGRRDFLLGASFLLSAGAALALKPRRQVSLLPPGKKLTDILPRAVNSWSSRDVSDLYAPETPESLEARLYGETVGRIFIQQETGTQIMMLMAHGDSQSNELQLHRPEVCYPAFGFSIIESLPVQLAIGKLTSLPGRRLIAESSQQRQAIIYWTRLGEYFPTSVTEQRLERLDTAMHRYIPDGLLARFSIAGPDTNYAFTTIEQFIAALILQIKKNERAVLIGSTRSNMLAANDHNS